jgi:dienelactone hydrolase
MDRIAATFINAFLCLAVMVGSSICGELQSIKKDAYKTFNRLASSSIMNLSKPQAWQSAVPEVNAITIKSTKDGNVQPALFYNSQSKHKKPLLLVLHSWSEDYYQQFSIPYGIWAVHNDWVFIHPNYRGAFTNSNATASELAISDILDALSYGKKVASIDSSRVYITGFSGGAMATLIMVGRYPELWTGAVAWVPVYDLTQWYATTKNAKHNYSKYIENSCGGPPLPNTTAFAECKKRSVSSYLGNASGKSVQIFIAVGIKDPFVPPGHSIQAFNDLAQKNEIISQKDIDYIDNNLSLPVNLKGNYHDSLFTDAHLNLIFERKSANVVLKIFDGRHDVIYNAGLVWLSKQKTFSQLTK